MGGAELTLTLPAGSCALRLQARPYLIHSFSNCLLRGMSSEYRDLAGDPQEAHRLGEDLNTCRNNSRLTFYSGCGTKHKGAQGKANFLLPQVPWSAPSQVQLSSQEPLKERGTDRQESHCWPDSYDGGVGNPVNSLTLTHLSSRLCEVGPVTMPTSRMKA